MNDKASLRRRLLEARAGLTPEQRALADAAIAANVLALLAAAPAAVLGVYWPMRGEPDLRAAYEDLAHAGVQLALPAVDGAAPLRFVSWAPGQELLRDALGVMVPAAGVPLRPDALLIPCVGFNEARLRLGYGGGYYDRTLAQTPRPRAIGVAYGLCRAEFAGDAHDVALDCVVSEAGVLR